MSSLCPFANVHRAGERCPRKIEEKEEKSDSGYGAKKGVVPAKCPFGYDSHTFKLGPLSCVICQALLFESTTCVPCSHKFCKVCISRFNDCPLCGADIQKLEPDADLQSMVDRFIEGHARIKRSQLDKDEIHAGDEKKKVIYEDFSLERGAFLVQHAMRAFRAQNFDSAKARLIICAEDIKEQLDKQGNTAELCSQLGAVLGMLGDCCRATGDSNSAVSYFEESVKFLSKLPSRDLEVSHTLSVSLNKIGDLKYYDADLESARLFYSQSLDVRRSTLKQYPDIKSQALDVAVSLAKVADIDRNLGNEKAAIEGFEEAIKCLESLNLDPVEVSLEQRRKSVLEFLGSQLPEQPGLLPTLST
ncbi:zinc ion binding protein [Wolffia australiana]